MERIDVDELSKLVEFLKANGIAEFDLKQSGEHIRLKFESAFAQPAVPFDLSQLRPAANAGAAPSTAAQPVPQVQASESELDLHQVKSPIVGTFYSRSAPTATPYVKVGDTVSVGDVLCIVEAMKLMNEIESDTAGEVVEVLVKDGQAVEFGQPLFAVRAK